MGDCKTCGGCKGNCSGCDGCGGSLTLTQGEIDMLYTLGQYSFLPYGRKADDMTPIYREENDYTEAEYSLILKLLETKQLISLESTPLVGADMSAYKDLPVHGSIGLTQRGQAVLELLDLQGAE